ncbi:MAG: cbb3-type cytochrome c oxidase subunit I [Rhodobacteraceae bacterium]|jgi:cytochrome o ubiquinol oxidase subunit 1|nr:cbb3-type cytochrome c oxidase subunit I [Paracoccaceae bacterium]
MLGRLTYDSLPFYSIIAFGGAAITVGAGLAVIGLITWFRLWGWLWKNYLTTLDHKRIGIMYIVVALVMLVRGFIDALMMRGQQMASASGHGFLEGDHFQQVFSAHGTIMIFFMATPFMAGLVNFVLPLQLGARDVAFPFMNALSFWLTAGAAGLVLISLVIGVFSTAGWVGYPPYSGVERNPGVGVDYWVWALFISGFATTMTGINFVVTILKHRAPGMAYMRMPIFVWTVLCSSLIILIAFPALTVAVALLGLDRLFLTHFFTADHGGNLMNFTNLFWMWGHPEVYLLVLPAFGVFSEVVATFSGKKIYGYSAMVKATVIIMFVSMLVWLHHFFTMGASATVNAVFGIATMIIGVPTGLKIFNWMFTMYRGRVRFHVSMYWTLGFMVLFVIGGATGVMHAIVPVDYNTHNTAFLVAHFHNMLVPGVLFGYVAGYMYWFPKAFGFTLNQKWGIRAFWGWAIGFTLAFMPLYALGLMGLPRRTANIYDPSFLPLLIVAFIGALCVLFGIVALLVQLYVSVRDRAQNRDLTGDPWDGRSLEWSIPSPPPAFNFARIPIVDQLDAFAEAKRAGRKLQYEPAGPVDLPVPTIVPMVMGVSAFLLGFAAIWYMWWLFVLSFLVMLGAMIGRSFVDHNEFRVPQREVEAGLRTAAGRAGGVQ